MTVDLTTIEYSSPEFLRFIRQPKDKCFDPFKLDVYSLGLTVLLGFGAAVPAALFVIPALQRGNK